MMLLQIPSNVQMHINWYFIITYFIQMHNLSYKTLKLLIQPLIENSIYHAAKESDKLCLIKVKIKIRDNQIVFRITDNGPGMTKQKLQEVIAALNSGQFEETHQHIGLENVNKRIFLKYGEESNMKIRSKERLGTSITFSIKVVKENP